MTIKEDTSMAFSSHSFIHSSNPERNNISTPTSIAQTAMAAAAAAAATTSIESLHSDLIATILRRMDGPTLTTFSSSSTLLRRLSSSSSDPALWAHLSLSTWPSLRHLHSLDVVDYHRFFLDSFPFPADDRCHNSSDKAAAALPAKLVSAVDLYHKGTPIFSCIVDTDASADGFLDSPFRVDALEWSDTERIPTTTAPARIEAAELTLSWVVMDPGSGRAVNVSSRRPVDVDVLWCEGETRVRFAMVLGVFAVGVGVTCREEDGHVREVGLTVEDVDGRAVSGRESLGLLRGAMEGERRRVVKQGRYQEWLEVRKERRERRVRRGGLLDWGCTFCGLLVFFSFFCIIFRAISLI